MPNDVQTGIQVRDVMSSPVKTVTEHDSVETAAKLMKTHNLGSIIVTDSNSNPIGIITEKDIINRVVAGNLLPRNINARQTMSYPVLSISSHHDIKEAAETMRTRDVRRLVVMDHGRMIGLIASNDIVAITPALIEIISEKTKITHNLPVVLRRYQSTGYCDKCRQWFETLQDVEGDFLCEECRHELNTD
jgi:CBS domain-containing protein